MQRKKCQTQIWAHRGASKYVPENTIEAFQKAIDIGADGIEFDVQFSRDKEVVIIHDYQLERVSNVYGHVQDYTLKELKTFRFNCKNPGFPDAVIPTLQEVYELFKSYDIKLNVEIKNDRKINEGIEEEVAAITKNMAMEQRVVFSSFNHNSIVKMKKLIPEAYTGFLCDRELSDPAVYARDHGVNALHPDKYFLNDPVYIRECKKNKIALHPYTVDEMQELWNCYNNKIEAVITNELYIAIALRRIWDIISNSEEKIYIWGIGAEAQKLIKFLPENRILGFMQSKKTADFFQGKNVFDVRSDVFQKDRHTLIIVATVFTDEIKQCCDNVGIDRKRLVFLFQ